MDKAILKKRKCQCCSIKNNFFSNVHDFKLWVLHENIIGGLIKQSKHWWHKPQQKLCWAEDLFKLQTEDKIPEELMVIKHNGNVPMKIR